MASNGKNARLGLVIGGVVVASLFLGGLAFAGGSSTPKKKPPVIDPTPEDPVVDPVDPVDDDPKVPPKDDKPANALEFDLSNNWGGIPMQLRVWLARGELASGIPGLARALGVKWWQAFRAMKLPYVTPEEAAKIAAANPELARFFGPNKADAADAKKGLDNAIKKGWPKPKDYATFATGSWGLGDILGSNFPYAGILTEGKNALPYINRDGKPLMQSYEGQLGAAISQIRNIIVAPKYTVLVGGINNAKGDALQTWGNTFAAYAFPDAYSKGLQLAIDAKSRYLQRALEIGIDLAKVAYPWPPGTVYKHPPWSFAAVVKKLKDYASRPVHDTGGTDQVLDGDVDEPAPDDDPPAEDGPEVIALSGNIQATVYTNGVLSDETEAPLVLLLHGRGGNAAQLVSSIDLSKPARFAFLRAPIDSGGDTFSWFAPAQNAPDAELAPAITAAAEAVNAAAMALMLKYKTKGLYVVGYSQGAPVAYRMIATEGSCAPKCMVGVNGGLIIAGYLPTQLAPKNPITTHLYACHGSADAAVAFNKGKAAFDLFVPYTNAPVWTPVPGGDHGLKSLRSTIKLLMEAMLP